MRTCYTLAIETSCDETCAAVVEQLADGGLTVLSNVVSSQIDIHKLYGGVVPEVASRNHLLAIENVYNQALMQAGVKIEQISQIAATTHPGLVGAVMVGRVFAESLALARGVPFISVNHLAGHIASVVLSNPTLKPPFVCLVVSGGHTSLYKVQSYKNIKILGHTMDDACGEAFDKVAKVLGLGYPGGPAVSRVAAKESDIQLVTKANYARDLNFSYSGLKSAVINYVHKIKQAKQEPNIADICVAFQSEAIKQLVVKCNNARGKLPLAVCGGVSANKYLRSQLPDALFPDISLCGDNAAMIAAAAVLGLRLDKE